MELRHLRSFVAVADELHFTRAAERLHIAQSPLSQQIRRLEQELGTRLFERDHHTVALTAAGEAMLEHARAALLHADRAADAARQAAAGRAGTLSVGFLGSAALELLPRILSGFRDRAPAAELRLVEAASREQLAALREGRLDVGFTRPPDTAHDLAAEVVCSEPMLIALPRGHPLGARKQLRLGHLEGEPLILFPRDSASRFYDQIIAACRHAGFSPRIVQEAPAMPTIVGLVAAGVGAALIPRSMSHLAPDHVTCHVLSGPPLRAEIAMVTRSHDHGPLLSAFVAHARSVLDRATGD